MKTVTLVSLSGCHMDRADYSQAQEILTGAIAELGSESLLSALCYNNLGMYYKRMESFLLAEEYYLKSLRIREEFLPLEHHDVIQIAHNLEEMYRV